MDVRVRAAYVLVVETLDAARVEPELRCAALELALHECIDDLMGYEDEWRYTGFSEFVTERAAVEDALAGQCSARLRGEIRGRPRRDFPNPETVCDADAPESARDARAPSRVLPPRGTRAQTLADAENYETTQAAAVAPERTRTGTRHADSAGDRDGRDQRVLRTLARGRAAYEAAQEAGAKTGPGEDASVSVPNRTGAPVRSGIHVDAERDGGRAARRISRRIREDARMRDDEASRHPRRN
jgi:hypothetical protein